MKDNKLIVEYGETKNHYTILKEKALMKDPTTREWLECVIYEQYKELNDIGEYVEIPESDRLIFVREYREFWNKFELCLDL